MTDSLAPTDLYRFWQRWCVRRLSVPMPKERCWEEDSEWRSALAVFRLQLERLSPERRSSSLQHFADIAEPFVVEVHAPATAGAGDLLLVKKPSKAFLDLLAAMGAVDNEHA